MYSAYKLNKQGDNIQPWRTPFPIWNPSVVSCPGTIAAYKIIVKPPLESQMILWYEEKSTKDSIIMVCPSFWFANSFAKAIMLRRKIKNKINSLFYINNLFYRNRDFLSGPKCHSERKHFSQRNTGKGDAESHRDDSRGGQGDHSSILADSLGFKTTSPAFWDGLQSWQTGKASHYWRMFGCGK